MMQPFVNIEILKKVLRLDPETGELFWLERPAEMFRDERETRVWNAKHAGRPAGNAPDKRGYRRVAIFRREYAYHRVVFALANDRWPDMVAIDHIDGDVSNNRPDNLREATKAQNACNSHRRRGPRTDNPVGVRPIASGRFSARIAFDGRSYNLGTFETEEEAKAARRGAAVVLHGEFARLDSSDEQRGGSHGYQKEPVRA